MRPHSAVKRQVLAALQACEEKKAQDVSILELEKGTGAFTDYFVICSGANPRQIQTIADSVEEKLESTGLRATHREGYDQADWVLLDYVDFVVHVFSEKARKFYDLERLWRSARRLKAAELIGRRAQPASSRAQSRDGARRPARSSRSTIRKKKTS